MAGHSFEEASIVMMVHMVLMFVPSLATAAMIKRFGPLRVACVGCCLGVVSAALNLPGMELWNFFTALAALGVFWNLLFLSSTALLGKACRPGEGPKVQAANDGIASMF